MKINTPRIKVRAGMTLLELTVVILVLLSLISILFIGANAWKKSSDRAGCIMNVRNAQQAIRGYANMFGLSPGATIPGGMTRYDVIVGPGLFLAKAPVCPGAGTYVGQNLTTIPLGGQVLMQCDFSNGTNHLPSGTGDW